MQTLVSESFSCKIHVGAHTHTPTFVTNAFKFGVAAGIIYNYMVILLDYYIILLLYYDILSYYLVILLPYYLILFL